MVNWACGLVSVTGTQKNATNFVSRFLYDGDKVITDPKLRYFARSFTNTSRQETLDEITKTFSGIAGDSEYTFVIPIDFTWSAYSCTICGDPQALPDKCITLMDACVEDQVSVDIKTAEGDMYFEEHITCDKQGQVSYACFDLQTCTCPDCEYDIGYASFDDVDEFSCPMCGKACSETVEGEECVDG